MALFMAARQQQNYSRSKAVTISSLGVGTSSWVNSKETPEEDPETQCNIRCLEKEIKLEIQEKIGV